MNHLLQSMNPGVCAPCTDGRNGMREKGGKRRFQTVLYGSAAGLSLPTQPGRTVIRQTQSDTTHESGGSRPARRRMIQVEINIPQLLLQHRVSDGDFVFKGLVLRGSRTT